jgi:hypothetical protein
VIIGSGVVGGSGFGVLGVGVFVARWTPVQQAGEGSAGAEQQGVEEASELVDGQHD